MALATPTATFPQQQVPNEAAAASSATMTTRSPEALSSSPNGWHSSGSIGPFFAVISVLAVLAFISCAVGRAYSRRAQDPAVAPLDSIKRRSLFGWVKERLGGLAYGGANLGSRLKPASFWRRGGINADGASGKNGDLPQP